MNHKLHIGGVDVDLSLPAAEIEDTINKKQQQIYLGLVVAEYKEVDERTAEITFHRNLPFNYYGNISKCLGHIDCGIISGLPEDCFMFDYTGQNKPLVAPLLPMGEVWYTPDTSFGNFYKQFVKTMVGEEISRVKVLALSDKVVVTIKFPRLKGKYDDDVADLEAELGDALGNHRGQTLTYKLYDIGQIIQRPQVKVKSYMGLVSYLKKTYDITLKIL